MQLILLTVTKQSRILGTRLSAIICLIGIAYLFWVFMLCENEFNHNMRRYYKEQNSKAFKNKSRAKLRKHNKQTKKRKKPKIIEPYDTKAFRDNPLNFDIEGFTESYDRQHHIKI